MCKGVNSFYQLRKSILHFWCDFTEDCLNRLVFEYLCQDTFPGCLGDVTLVQISAGPEHYRCCIFGNYTNICYLKDDSLTNIKNTRFYTQECKVGCFSSFKRLWDNPPVFVHFVYFV